MKTVILCGAIIYDEKGKVLITQRSKIKKKFPLLWESPGGVLELGETPEECVRREIKEELGCELQDLKLFDVDVFITEENERHVRITYTGRAKGQMQPNCEVEDVQWITLCDVDHYDFCTLRCKEKIFNFYNCNQEANK